MGGLDLAHVRHVEHENARLKDEVDDLKAELKDLQRELGIIGRPRTGRPKKSLNSAPPSIEAIQSSIAEIELVQAEGLPRMTTQELAAYWTLRTASPHIVSKVQIQANMKTNAGVVGSRIAAVVICRLRRKLAGSKWQIITYQDVGYALREVGK